MTQKSQPECTYPVAFRKIFDGEITGPVELSIEEIAEARAWRKQLELDIVEIENSLCMEA